MKKLILLLCFALCSCVHPSSTYIKTLKVKTFNCVGPKADILFDEHGYCKFKAVSGEKCIYRGLVLADEEIRICKVVAPSGLKFIRECNTDNSVECYDGD